MKTPAFTLRKERVLGIAEGKHRYDLPLSRDSGTFFLMLLVGLMTTLAVLALSASFTLSGMTQRWTSGLENKATIEIPAQGADGKILSADEIENTINRLQYALQDDPAIESLHAMTRAEVQKLLEPWLGGATQSADGLPLPGLVSLDLKTADTDSIRSLQRKIVSAAPSARLDTHESWMKDILRFAGALKLAASLLVIVVGITTVTAVAGAIRTRMDVHREQVELLHLMGAVDTYIARQFQRHSMILAAQGGMMGAALGIFILLLVKWTSGKMDVTLLPDFRLSAVQIVVLLCLPLVATAIAAATSRFTVLRTLSKMP
jgi:cell division transport system permease protein